MNANVMENELVTIPRDTAMQVFTTENALDPFLARIRKEIDAFVPDMNTASGRKEIASMAYKVVRSKTYLEGVGKALADEAKQIPKKIDASRKLIRDTLDGWRDEVRAPLDQWEAAEEARIKRHSDAIGYMNFLTSPTNEIGQPYSAATLRECLAWVESVKIGQHCDEFEAEYARAKDASISALRETIAKREVYEAEQVELAALRKQAEERAARDRDEALQREAAEAAKREAEQAAERQRLEAERAAAAEIARIEAIAKAERDAAEQREMEAKAAIERAEQRAAETEARIKREADEQRAREAAEQAAREADTQHKAGVNRAAVAALVEGGIAEDIAKAVIVLIARKQIPAVTINY